VRVIPIALASHYQQEVTTIACCLKVTRSDAAVHGFTDHDNDLVIDGITYKPGFAMSAMESTDTLAVGNMELTILPNEVTFPVVDILAGRWKAAQFEIFQVNYLSIGDGRDVLKGGTVGEVKKRLTSYTVEFRSRLQALQQSQGITAQKNCRARLGDAKCLKDLTAFTYTGTIDSTTDRRHFVDAARAEATDWFAEGQVTFNTGLNIGITAKIKANAAGAFILVIPLPYDLAVGDTYTMIAGCRKRRDEDCIAKFDNVLNMQSEPDAPGQDKITSPAAAVAQPDSTPVLPTETFDPDGGE
jgi:uncharacterized phage protein (TIGR02218 family)